MSMNPDTKRQAGRVQYWLGTTVYHRLADERRRGLVTGVTYTPEGYYYWVTWPDLNETKHYEMELAAEYIPDYES